MKQKDLVSVIVPVYNIEDYITKCVMELVNQTYEKIEIILIDDGSTDRSGSICDDLNKSDSRIKVIHTENQGQSNARNLGLDVACGQYVLFVDGDDYLDRHCIEWVVEAAKKTDADVVCFAWYGFFEDDTIPTPKKKSEILFSKEDFFANLNDTSFYVWNKLYKREIIGSTRFQVGRLHEEIAFLEGVYNQIESCVYLPVKLYNYLLKRENATFSFFDERRMYVFGDIAHLLKMLDDSGYSRAEIAVAKNALDLYQSMYFNAYSVGAKQYTGIIHAEFRKLYNAYRSKGCDSLFCDLFYIAPYIVVIKKKIKNTIGR